MCKRVCATPALPPTAPRAQAMGYSSAGNQLSQHVPTGCHVEYIRQIRPLVPIEVFTWFDLPSRAFIFELHTCDQFDEPTHAATVILSTGTHGALAAKL